jgi:hypothetical protein
VVDVRVVDHRRHGGFDVVRFEFIAGMGIPNRDEVMIGHGRLLFRAQEL